MGRTKKFTGKRVDPSVVGFRIAHHQMAYPMPIEDDGSAPRPDTIMGAQSAYMSNLLRQERATSRLSPEENARLRQEIKERLAIHRWLLGQHLQALKDAGLVH